MTTALDPKRELLNQAEAAELLGIKSGTLSVWRCSKRYSLPWVKVGRAVRYSRESVEAFIESRTVSPGGTVV